MRRLLTLTVVLCLSLPLHAGVQDKWNPRGPDEPKLIRKLKTIVRGLFPKPDEDTVSPPKPNPCPPGTTC